MALSLPLRSLRRCRNKVVNVLVLLLAGSVVVEDWQEEAQRCWAPGEDGVVPGFIGDMVTPGREYDPLVRMYFPADKKPEPKESRPWRREAKAPSASEAAGSNVDDPRAKDFNDTMRFFGKDGDEAPGGGVVLDLGCGEGYMARRFINSGRFDGVFALDVDWDPLEAARTAAEEDGLSPEGGLFLLRADIQELPFRAGAIDFAWWGMGMHKVLDPGTALNSVAAALRPGGRLMATLIPSVAPGRRREDVERLAQEAGFSEVEVEQPSKTEVILRAVK